MARRYILLANFLIAISMMPASAKSSREDVHDACSKLSGLAYGIMELRQIGVPMPEAMELAHGAEGKLGAALVQVVKMAYLIPRQRSSAQQVEAATEFQSSTYGMCYDSALNGRR